MYAIFWVHIVYLLSLVGVCGILICLLHLLFPLLVFRCQFAGPALFESQKLVVLTQKKITQAKQDVIKRSIQK